MNLAEAVDYAWTGSFRARRAMTALRRRKNDFDTRLEMELTAVGMVPEAREALEYELDKRWNLESGNIGSRCSEVVIGGGLHASIYAAVRDEMGFPRPLIVERGRVGGAFAMTKRASWWTNSSNRPGPAGLPGENRGLNHIPGAPVQAENLSSVRFVPNTDMGYCIRTSIAHHAKVKRATVTEVSLSGLQSAPYRVTMADGTAVFTGRVLDARGFGDHKAGNLCDGTRVMTSVQFMKRMDDDFPLRDLGRVAIIGSGKSALCVAEALLGLGPCAHMSVARLDFVEQVDLYAPGLARTCEMWKDMERTRYATLGGFLQPLANGRQRLRVFDSSGRLTIGYGRSYVNERQYETVVVANGWECSRLGGVGDGEWTAFGQYPPLATRNNDLEYFRIGVRAGLAFSAYEKEMRTMTATDENLVAAFRLGGFTAALAAQLPGTGVA